MFKAYLRKDGRKGIRNHIAVVYLVECAHHVAKEIAWPYRAEGVHTIGFPGCFPNDYAQLMLERLCTHPNVGAVLLVSLGCESFNRFALEKAVAESGRPVSSIVIQKSGGTLTSVEVGRAWVESQLEALKSTPRVDMGLDELVLGTICGGSDATSGITGNPAVGLVFDKLGAQGATCIF